MNLAAEHRYAESFFLQTERGQRFCIFHQPQQAVCRGAFLHVHPFAEELNKSRPMVALQARAMAEMGYAVLLIDLYGCGDSSGDFSEARWEIWRDDLAAAWHWLAGRVAAPLHLWGLRLGALLALDFAQSAPHRLAGMTLWQPVLDPNTYLTQFFRLALANGMLSGTHDARQGVAALRQRLADGRCVEIAGYELQPALVNAIVAIDSGAMPAPACPVHWFEIVATSQPCLPRTSENLRQGWKTQGCAVKLNLLQGVPFWATQEVTLCHELIAAMGSNLLPETA